MKRVLWHCFSLTIAALLLGGLVSCKNTDYGYKAVEEARKFALNELREMSQTQRDFIRYSTPTMYQYTLYYRHEHDEHNPSKDDLVQTCISWDVPGAKEPVVVFGVSERNLMDWQPLRILRKKFVEESKEFQAALENARRFGTEKLRFLKNNEIDRIRFDDPEVFVTNFDLSDKIEKKEIQKPVLPKWMRKSEPGKEEDPKDKEVQRSFVWKANNTDELIVISGIGKKDFEGWSALTGLLRTKAELEQHKVVEKPKQEEKKPQEPKIKTPDKVINLPKINS